MSANHTTPISMQDLPKEVLQPLTDVLAQGLTFGEVEITEQIFIAMVRSPVAQVVPPDVIACTAVAAMEQIAHVLGGRSYYISKGRYLMLERMYRAIRANFNGNNHAELAREHGITEMRIRQILGPVQPVRKRKIWLVGEQKGRIEWPTSGPNEGCHSPESQAPGHAQQTHAHDINRDALSPNHEPQPLKNESQQ